MKETVPPSAQPSVQPSVPRRSFLQLVSRAREKPLDVVWFRGKQYVANLARERMDLWPRLEVGIAERWKKRAGAQRPQEALFLSTSALGELAVFLETNPAIHQEFREERERVVSGTASVFESPHSYQSSPEDPIVWNTDWRFGHSFPNQYFHHYNFYDFNKDKPYDVKFPWEFSRLSFLMVPSLLSAVDAEESWWNHLEMVLASFRSNNPLAFSVNWDPMECSMRGINLFFLYDLVRAHCPERTSLCALLGELCELHGSFIYRTAEYTDITSNHFAANVVSLLCLGSVLRKDAAEARQWQRYGMQHLEKEVCKQMLPDGVQYEKSIPYHRLVTQLFVLGMLLAEKNMQPLGQEARDRLQAAIRYSAAYTRPDGLAPVWGDNDDARVFWFDLRALRDHRGLIGLGADYFDDEKLRAASDVKSVEAVLMLGQQPRPIDAGFAAQSPQENISYFKQGGMFSYRRDGMHLLVDIGEVGLLGQGGHGHLDTLSFELSLSGAVLVIDPGSFVYTGDPLRRNAFRSSARHNLALLDDREIGTISPIGLWRLGNESAPEHTELTELATSLVLQSSHRAFASPSGSSGSDQESSNQYTRTWEIDRESERMSVRDSFRAVGHHSTKRYLQLAPAVSATRMSPSIVRLRIGEDDFLLEVDRGSELAIEPGEVSFNYGQSIRNSVVVISSSWKDKQELWFTISSVDDVAERQ